MFKTWNLVFGDLVEGDKNLEEESTKWRIFFGGRKRMSKLLASAGLFPIPSPLGKPSNVVPIWTRIRKPYDDSL